MKGDLEAKVGFGEDGVAIEGLGPLYELVRDFIKWWQPAFEGQELPPDLPHTQPAYGGPSVRD